MKLAGSFLDSYKSRPVNWGYDALGYIVYLRTYSRPLPNGSNEQWWQTIQRVVEGVYEAQETHCNKNGLPWLEAKAQRSAQKMYDLMFNFKFLPPGRGLWAMGTDYVRTKGSAALNNCAFISTENISKDFSYPFTFLMDMSMLGVGVGADTRGAGTIVIKNPFSVLREYYVEDSREGWVNSVRVILDAFSIDTGLPVFNYSFIRESGTPLKGFGGLSSGHKPLHELHSSLISLLQRYIDKPLPSGAIVDIFNMIGRAVVAGGIRRTAEIMLGDPDDQEFIKLKDPKLWPTELQSHRWASNNSLLVSGEIDYAKYADQIMTNGEPGFFWIDNARKYRRMKDGPGMFDMNVMGVNPCGEIALESGEFCNLVEVYPAHHSSLDEFLNTLKYAYLYAKSVSLMSTHNQETNAIIARNRRVGVSVSGVVQSIHKFGVRKLFKLLDDGYQYLSMLDRKYSRWLGVPNSIKLTTVKPSGTVSLLSGSTPGVHYPHAPAYVRNVRFDPHSPLLPLLRKAGYKVEESYANDNTFVVSFPIKEKHVTKSKNEVSLWEQFELAAQMQYWWADNAVSVTVTVKDSERHDVANALAFYESRLKSVSILPLENGSYKQMPYTVVHPAELNDMIVRIRNLDNVTEQVHEVDEVGCTNDMCEIKI